MWPRRRTHIPFLITGHPRCGTTSAGGICRAMHLDVGDEGVGTHGACSWMLAVDDRRSPYGNDAIGRSRRNLKWDWLVLVVRDLRVAVPSVMVEDRFAPKSFAYRRKHIRKQLGIDIAECPDAFTTALHSITAWVRIIVSQTPGLCFRIEDQQEHLRRFIAEKLDLSRESSVGGIDIRDNADKRYGGIKPQKPDISASRWRALPVDVEAEIDWYCSRFGYANPVTCEREVPALS